MTTGFNLQQHTERDESWLTASNDRFSAETEHWVHGLIRDAKVNLERLDKEIFQVQEVANRLSGLFERREHEAARIRTIQGSISALKRIPPEVLAEIFIYFIPEDYPYITIPNINLYCYPWFLGRVCSRWRQIMWETPRLWSSFYILETKEGRKYPAAQILNEILSKTTAAFSIRIHTGKLIPILEALIPFQRRIKDISIYQMDFVHFQSTIDFAPSLMRLLTRIKLRVAEEDPLSSGHESTSFEAVPRLQDLAVVALYHHQNATEGIVPQLSPFPWGQLTSLSISKFMIPMIHVHNILQGCTSVTQCTLGIVHCSIRTPGAHSILLPHLKTFDFKFLVDDEGASVDNFMDLFKLPSLSHLTMTSIFQERGERFIWAPFIISLVSRSGCMLKRLCIDSDDSVYSEGGDEDINAVLKVLPSLEKFSINFVMPPIFFEAIRTQNLLPKLKFITVSLSVEGFEALVNLLDSYIDPQDPTHSRGSIIAFYISLERSTESSDVVKEYRKKEHIYSKARIGVEIYN